MVNDGATARIAATGTNTGTADVTCDSVNGFTTTGLTCSVPAPSAPPNCTDQNKSWTVGANTCSGPTGVTTGGTNKTLSSVSGGSGQAVFSCDNTSNTYSLQAGSTCLDAASAARKFSQVDTGSTHACGIDLNQDIRCWGNNAKGKLGDGTTTNRNTPTLIALSRNWIQISVGRAHTCALDDGGDIYCWGANTYVMPVGSSGNRTEQGLLGNGTTPDRLVPTKINSTLKFKELSVGNFNSVCALSVDGVGYCWGDNGSAELNKTAINDGFLSPLVMDTNDAWTSISSGIFGGCGITINGIAKCWGSGQGGELGLGNIQYASTTSGDFGPNCVSTGSGGVCNAPKRLATEIVSSSDYLKFSGGQYNNCGLKNNGEIHCAGANNYGALGVAKSSRNNMVFSKISAVDFFVDISDGSAARHCGITSLNTAKCWGFNDDGSLGNGGTTTNGIPTVVSGGLSWKKDRKSVV